MLKKRGRMQRNRTGILTKHTSLQVRRLPFFPFVRYTKVNAVKLYIGVVGRGTSQKKDSNFRCGGKKKGGGWGGPPPTKKKWKKGFVHSKKMRKKGGGGGPPPTTKKTYKKFCSVKKKRCGGGVRRCHGGGSSLTQSKGTKELVPLGYAYSVLFISLFRFLI